MPKGILKLSKSKKGKVIVALDRLNGKPPMPLSNVSFDNLEHHEKECEYEMTGGIITEIKVDGAVVHGGASAHASSNISSPQSQFNNPSGTHPVYEFRDALDIQQTQLPFAVRRLGNFDIDNFALKYQKAARYIDNKFFFFKNDYREYKDGRPPTGDKFFIRPNYGSLNFAGIGKRQEAKVKSLFPDEKSEIVKLTPDWRLICGLSGGIYETNMTLHHVYGVPYIPASSIKGVVRSWVITKVFGANVPAEEKEYPMVNAEYRALSTSKLFCALFGAPESIEKVSFKNGKPEKKKDKNGKETDDYVIEKKGKSAIGKESQGKVVFFEGLPIAPPQLMPDVINVHYQDWYKEKDYSPPTDFQKTVPVIFLTVTSESEFQTAVASHYTDPIKNWEGFEILANPVGLNGGSTLVELAKKWLDLALTEHGIGAKTAVGYGYMKTVSNNL